MSNIKLIELLNTAYENETKAFRGYVFAAVSITGPLHDVYEEVFKSFADREREHMYEVGEKITALNGKVSTNCLPITEIEESISKGYDAVLGELQNYEDETLEMYQVVHKYAESIGDLPTVLLLEHIIQEEQEHFDELERILLDTTKKPIVEVHDVLEVDARAERTKKLATLFKASSDLVERLVGQLKIVNRQMADMEQEAEFYDADVEMNPGYIAAQRKKHRLMKELDDLDSHWMRDYFGENPNDTPDEVESILTMRDYE